MQQLRGLVGFGHQVRTRGCSRYMVSWVWAPGEDHRMQQLYELVKV